MSSTPQRGMGLVELLVWMAISLLIISVIGVVYGNTKQLTRVNDTVSRLQENGRFVVYLLDRDIRMAGFHGCDSATVTRLSPSSISARPAWARSQGVFDFRFSPGDSREAHLVHAP